MVTPNRPAGAGRGFASRVRHPAAVADPRTEILLWGTLYAFLLQHRPWWASSRRKIRAVRTGRRSERRRRPSGAYQLPELDGVLPALMTVHKLESNVFL